MSSGAIVIGEVSALDHELRDDPVEGGSGVSETLLSGAKRPEIFGRFGDNVRSQLDDDLTQWLPVGCQGHGALGSFLG